MMPFLKTINGRPGINCLYNDPAIVSIDDFLNPDIELIAIFPDVLLNMEFNSFPAFFDKLSCLNNNGIFNKPAVSNELSDKESLDCPVTFNSIITNRHTRKE